MIWNRLSARRLIAIISSYRFPEKDSGVGRQSLADNVPSPDGVKRNPGSHLFDESLDSAPLHPGYIHFNNLVGPKPSADSVKLSWDNPQLVRVGVRYDLTDRTFLVADVDWEDWSEFSENPLSFEGGR